MELEEAGGIQILSDTLRADAEGATEEEKSEAAGLLAQGRNSTDIFNLQLVHQVWWILQLLLFITSAQLACSFHATWYIDFSRSL